MATMRHLLLLGTLIAFAAAPTLAAAKTQTKTQTNTLPSACLRDASTLCQGTATNTMACLMKLAKAGDVRVSKACATALPAMRQFGAPKTTRRHTRFDSLQRLLVEATSTGSTANCVGDNAQVTVTVTSSQFSGPGAPTCGGVCCKWINSAGACCRTATGAFCLGGNHAACTAPSP